MNILSIDRKDKGVELTLSDEDGWVFADVYRDSNKIVIDAHDINTQLKKRLDYREVLSPSGETFQDYSRFDSFLNEFGVRN